MISHIKLMGSLVYRTRQTLNNDSVFMQNIRKYKFADECMIDNKMQLWHLSGTPDELFEWMVAVKGNKNRFPAVLNFQPVRQDYGKETRFHYTLAIVTPTNREWTTGQREGYTFDLVLRPIYTELIRQIDQCGHFKLGFGDIPHFIQEVYTTGSRADELIKGRFAELVDGLEIQNLTLTLNSLCPKEIETIVSENLLVTRKT